MQNACLPSNLVLQSVQLAVHQALQQRTCVDEIHSRPMSAISLRLKNSHVGALMAA